MCRMCGRQNDGASLNFRGFLKSGDSWVSDYVPKRSSAFGPKLAGSYLHLSLLLECQSFGMFSSTQACEASTKEEPVSTLQSSNIFLEAGLRAARQAAHLFQLAWSCGPLSSEFPYMKWLHTCFLLVRQVNVSMTWAKFLHERCAQSSHHRWQEATASLDWAGSLWLAKVISFHICVLPIKPKGYKTYN